KNVRRIRLRPVMVGGVMGDRMLGCSTPYDCCLRRPLTVRDWRGFGYEGRNLRRLPDADAAGAGPYSAESGCPASARRTGGNRAVLPFSFPSYFSRSNRRVGKGACAQVTFGTSGASTQAHRATDH